MVTHLRLIPPPKVTDSYGETLFLKRRPYESKGCVMLGRLLAGLDESPGELIILDGKPYKSYRGMGSIGPMWEQSADRYFQEKDTRKKLVPEGIEGAVPYQGRLTDTLYQMIGGLRAAMGYCGAHNIQEMQTITEFIRVTGSGKIENHPHDIKMIKNAPNYRGKETYYDNHFIPTLRCKANVLMF